MKQIISITLLSLVATVFANPTGEVATPEECQVGTPKYDLAACKEACAKEPYTKEPYCEDFNSAGSIPTTPVAGGAAVPAAQPGGVKTVVPDASPSVPSAPAVPLDPQSHQEPGVTLPADKTDVKSNDLHPEHEDDHLSSGGISFQSSIIVSSLCLFLSFFF